MGRDGNTNKGRKALAGRRAGGRGGRAERQTEPAAFAPAASRPSPAARRSEGTPFAAADGMTRNQRFGLLAAAGAGVAISRAWMAWPRYSFRDRSVVITGGSRGLGLEIARILAAEGASLTLVSRDEHELARARRSLEATGGTSSPSAATSHEFAEVEAAVRQVVDHHGRLDVLINCAGVIQVGPMEHMALDDYEAAMNVHFRGPLHTMLAALPYMRRQHGGRIVNIASIGGKVPVPHLAPYAASKFALVGLSSSLRAELASSDILITTVSPGLMRTGSPINASMKGQHEAEFAWFAVSDALPGLSVASSRAARQVVEACRRGQAELIISLPARACGGLLWRDAEHLRHARLDGEPLSAGTDGRER